MQKFWCRKLMSCVLKRKILEMYWTLNKIKSSIRRICSYIGNVSWLAYQYTSKEWQKTIFVTKILWQASQFSSEMKYIYPTSHITQHPHLQEQWNVDLPSSFPFLKFNIISTIILWSVIIKVVTIQIRKCSVYLFCIFLLATQRILKSSKFSFLRLRHCNSCTNNQ